MNGPPGNGSAFCAPMISQSLTINLDNGAVVLLPSGAGWSWTEGVVTTGTTLTVFSFIKSLVWRDAIKREVSIVGRFGPEKYIQNEY